MINNFIFDLDGLLVNTEKLGLRLWQDTAEKYNFQVDEDWAISLMGRGSSDTKTLYIEKFGEEKATEIRNYRRKLILETIKNEGVEPMPGALELLELLKAKEYKMALATGSIKRKIQYVFQSVDIQHYFDVIISGEMVSHGKPDPETFILAADGLHVDPKETIVLEDSPFGIEAAHSIGATTILIPDLYQPTEEIINKCSYMFNSLYEVIDKIEEITKHE